MPISTRDSTIDAEASSQGEPEVDQFCWIITRRWLSYEGEIRTAVVRVFLLAIFYAMQLLHFLVFSDRSVAEVEFHRYVTFLVAAWLLVSLIVLVALRQKIFPEPLKYFTCGIDLLLLTLAALLGSGPASSLVFCYFLIVASAGLRFSLGLVFFATLGAACCYMGLVGWVDPVWFDSKHETPPIRQLVTCCNLLALGVCIGHLVHMQHLGSRQYAFRYRSLQQAESNLQQQ